MKKTTLHKIAFKDENELLAARRLVKTAAQKMGFGIVDQTRLVTAVSEITRNAFEYAAGGIMQLEEYENRTKTGLRVVITDQGPGIADIDLAMTDGYTSGRSLGKGLSGSKRLVDEFLIQSEVDEGTEVTLIKWPN